MQHFALLPALALSLAACSGGEPASDPAEGTVADNSAEPAMEDASPEEAENAIDRMAASDAAASAEASRADEPAQREVAEIPLRFRGTWARTQADCGARSFYRVTIAADRISFFEDGGFASDIRVDGPALAITYPFENPNGVTEARVAYVAHESDDRIRVRQGDGESYDYVRCD